MAGYLGDWSPLATFYDPLMVGSIDRTDEIPHDRGIVRAMNATYKPNKKVVGDPKCTVFAARLSPNTNEDMLEELFSEYGDIKHLRLVRDIVTGYSKRYAFIEFYDERSAYSATKNCKMMLDNTEIFVDNECERTMSGWIPRRLGGGFGGRKEAGQLRFGGRDKPFRRPIIIPNKRNIMSEESRTSVSQRSDSRERQERSGRDRDRDRSSRERSGRDKSSKHGEERDRHSDSRRRSRRSRSRERRRSKSRDRDRKRDRDRDRDREHSSRDWSGRSGRF